MDKKISVLALTALLTLTVLTVVYMPKVDATEDPWYTTETLATASDFGWTMIDQDMMVMPNGDLWLVINRRLSSQNETWYRKSTDNGETWASAVQWELPIGDYYGSVTAGSRIWVSLLVDDSTIPVWSDNYMIYSDDNGGTWSDPIQIHDHNNPGNLVPYVRMKHGFMRGIYTSDNRVMMSGFSMNADRTNTSATVFWSDGNGESTENWNGSQVDIAQTIESSESSVVELVNGTYWIFMRNSNTGGDFPVNGKWGSFSEDGGQTWTTPYEIIEDITESPVHAYRYTTTADSDQNRILIAYDNSTVTREKLTVAISYDEAQTWPYKKTFDDDDGLRSESPCIIILPNNTIGVSYGKQVGGQELASVKFARFNVEWLTDGADTIGESTEDPETFIFSDICGQANNTDLSNIGSTRWGNLSAPTVDDINDPNVGTILETTYEVRVANDSSFTDIYINETDLAQSFTLSTTVEGYGSRYYDYRCKVKVRSSD